MNRFVPVKEVAAEFVTLFEEIEKRYGKKAARAAWYDCQTVLGRFPFSRKQREKFIKTGKY